MRVLSHLQRLRPTRLSLAGARKMTSNQSPRTIKIDITSDTICPFCFIGKRKLDKAIELANERGMNIKVERKFHPFLLDPSLKPNSALDKRRHYEAKFGKDRMAKMEPMMKARGREVGIDFSYDGKVSQTTDSHRLLSYAYDEGGETLQLALIEKLFNGYFEREQDIGALDFLSEQAAAAGVFQTPDAAKSWLQTDEKKEEVANGIRSAQRMGVTGVPFFVLNNKYAISGAEDPETFIEVFESILGRN